MNWERWLSNQVAEAVDEYLSAIPADWDEDTMRREINDIVIDAAQYAVDRFIDQLRREKESACEAQAQNPNSLWPLAVDLMLTQAAVCSQAAICE